MKILSILLIGIASLGVVVEFKSDKTVIDSIANYVVITVFYIWAYLAQKYSEVSYKGGAKSSAIRGRPCSATLVNESKR
ncbi:hypothetical protein MNBD_GAMMA21-1119 [hydrothermal vent metagenome]|uniref:Uncharacterized protein n=1 Tax=hydrothermal vent metagenome TaxID=652676 RepID=A0A3B1A5H5_9ZZZZ